MPLSRIPPGQSALSNYCGPTYDPTTNCGEEVCPFLDTFTSSEPENIQDHIADTGQSWGFTYSAIYATVDNGEFEILANALDFPTAYVDVGASYTRVKVTVNPPADAAFFEDLNALPGFNFNGAVNWNVYGLWLDPVDAEFPYAYPVFWYSLEPAGAFLYLNAGFGTADFNEKNVANNVVINYGEPLVFEFSASGNDALIEISTGGALVVSELLEDSLVGFDLSQTAFNIWLGGFEADSFLYSIDSIEIC